MKRFVQHLIDKGYKVNDEYAELDGLKFKICSGIINRANGNYKSYWLELR